MIINSKQIGALTSMLNSVQDLISNTISNLEPLNSFDYLGVIKAASAKSTTQKLEQAVTIQADFPNVSSSGEIEEAFNNLINRAA
jgi:hypothetical protein